jgi:hypothetical protein
MKITKCTLLVLVFISLTAIVSAQDIIVLKTGIEVKGNVTEITPDVIKFKVWQNQNATENSMVLKTDVFMIKYANGFKEIINPDNRQVEAEKKAAIERQLAADKQAVIERQLAADKQAAIERQLAAEKQAAIERQLAADKQAAIERQLATDKQAAIERQLAADKQAIIKDRPINDNPIKVKKIDPSVSRPIRHFTAGIFGGVSLPIGLYKASNFDDYSDAAGAKTGFHAGVNLGYRMNHALSFLLEGQFTLHSYSMNISDVRYIYSLKGNWFHINVFPTFRFDVPIVANKVGFYAQGGAGVTISLLDGDFFDVLDAAKITGYSTHFGYSGGIGLSFSGVNLGVRYVGGNPVFEDYKPLISQIQATIGFQF